MTHHTVLHIAAYMVLILSIFIALIDALSEADVDLALRVKWSAFWYAVRYLTMVSALFLALDTIF